MASDLAIHPIAALFPMLAGEELSALADDIKANGLQLAVVVKDGVLLDGRNRLAACRLADVEPTFREYEGTDETAFIISANLHRRHLTRDQRNAVMVGLREQGMTLTKIAEAVGVSVDTAQRATRLISDFGIENARGQLRPAHYAPRQESPSDEGEGDEEEDGCWNCKHNLLLDGYSAEDEWYCTARGEKRAPGYDDGGKECEDWALDEDEQEEEVGRLPHVAQNSGNNEWYTPGWILDAARDVMGGIDLDPASSETANALVRAAKWFSREDDGLAQPWSGRVWMNPPYSQTLVQEFAAKFLSERDHIEQAVVLVNNATETGWFQDLLGEASAVCFLKGRVKYLNENGEPQNTPLQGQAVLYFGERVEVFSKRFGEFGQVLVHA